MSAGYTDEARAWRDWLLRAVAGDPADLQIMYGVGRRAPAARDRADWLAGYEGSRPVRIGNAAAEQFQLDVYGEVMDALHLARARRARRRTPRPWRLQQRAGRVPRDGWREPDEGIWEVRGPRAALHALEGDGLGGVRPRGQGRASEFGLDGPLSSAGARCAQEIHDEVCAEGFDAERSAFTQYYGSTAARREPADDPARRLPAGRRPARRAARSRRSSAS